MRCSDPGIATRLQSVRIRETMVGSPRSPLLLLAALIVALALAVSPAAAQGPRKGRLLGGLMEADVNEEGVQEALSFAVSEFNKRSNDAYQSRAMRVVRARKQVRPAGQGAATRGPESGCRVGARGLCLPEHQSPAPGGRGLPAVPSPALGPSSSRGRAAPSPQRPRESPGMQLRFSPERGPGLSRRLQPLRGTGQLAR